MNLAKKLAKNLKLKRGQTSQVDFSKKIGISRATLNRLESCSQNVTLKTVEQILKGLKCTIEELFK